MISGTSADGIDVALCEIEGAPPRLDVRIVHARTIPYDPPLRERVLTAMQPGAAGADALCVLNFEIGEAFAQAALDLIEDEAVDLIGSHGQTVWHQFEADGRVSATLQIGESSVIAERTGRTTVADFRTRDVAAGGQGAPLVSYLDWLLMRHDTAWRAVQNIGGIGNVTFLPPLTEPDRHMIAFDTGPGNALIDSAISLLTNGRQSYDDGGGMAALGIIDDEWLAKLMNHPYYAMPAPKSTGREVFSAEMAASLIAEGRVRGLSDHAILATLTALTAESIARSYRDFAPEPMAEVIIAGGGRHNRTMIEMLRRRVAPAVVHLSDDVGINGDYKEAMLFAVLAYETWHHRPGCLPEQTGAAHASVLGNITPGDHYVELLRKTWGSKLAFSC
ncbi:MAG: anhydro-N-acetylmuramic acid kinase [Anaerolineae bacterium]|nr:anhydro-N-acetylmuramic acid kinase [Anaerolineae bacterium]